MRLAQLLELPPHLLAASIVRSGQRIPIKLWQVGTGHLIVSGAPLHHGERATVTIACPLSADPCTVTAQATCLEGEMAWLSLVA